MEPDTRQHPPFLLHLLAGLFTLSALVNIAGIPQTLQSWLWLLAAEYFPHPAYTLFKSLFLALLSVVVAISIWTRHSFALRLCQLSGVLVFAWFWFDRVLLTRNPLPFKQHLFPLLVSVVLLAFVLTSSWLLSDFFKSSENANGG